MAISIKGILVGLVCGIVLSVVGGLVLGFALGALYGPAAMADVAAITSGTLTPSMFFMDAVVSIAAGYIAARVAGRGELVNAALCNLIGAGIVVLLAQAGPPAAMTSALILLLAEPLFGLLGGYIRLRQVAEYA